MARGGGNIPDDLTKRLNEAIQQFNVIAGGMAGRTRDLMTAIYMMNEGFIKTKEQFDAVISDIEAGKFEGHTLKKTLKSYELLEEQIDDIVDLRKELNLLSDKDIASHKSLQQLLSLIYDTELERYKVAENFISAFEEMETQLRAQHKMAKKISDAYNGSYEIINKQIGAANKIRNVFENSVAPVDDLQAQLDNLKSVIDNITASEFEIGGSVFDAESAIKYLNSIGLQQQQLIAEEHKVRMRNLKTLAAFQLGMRMEDGGQILNADTGQELTGKRLKDAQRGIDSLSASYTQYVDMLARGESLTEDATKNMSESLQVALQQAAMHKNLNEMMSQSMTVSEGNLNILLRYRPALKAAHDAAEKLAETGKEMADVFPSWMSKMLGIDNIAADIETSFHHAITSFNEELVKTGSSSKAVGKAIHHWTGSLTKSIGLVGILAVSLGALYKIAQEFGEAYKEFGHEAHISTIQAKKLYQANLKFVASQKNQLNTMKDIQELQAAYIHGTGQVFDMTSKKGQELINKIGEINTVFGLSAEQGMELYESFTRLGSSKDEAIRMMKNTLKTAEDSGLSSTMIAEDLIKNAELLATYFAGASDKAAMTAINVRRMGVSLEQAGKMADRMISGGMESFMTDMFELAAMGGPDLSSAFEFGIRGDLEGMTEEIMKSIGSVEEFNKMDFLQRKKLANTLGMSTDEIATSLMLRKKMMGLEPKYQKMVEENMAAFGNIDLLSKEDIKNRADQIDATKRLSVAWDKIKYTFAAAIMPLVEEFSKTLGSSTGIIDGIVLAVKGVAKVLKLVLTVVKGMLVPFQWIGDAATWISKKIAEWFPPTEKATDAVKTFNDEATVGLGILKGFGTVLAAGWGLKKIYSAIVGVKKFTSSMSTMVEATKKSGIIKYFGGVYEKLKSLLPLKKKLADGGSVLESVIPDKKQVDMVDAAKEVVKTGGGVAEKAIPEKVQTPKTGTNILDSITKNLNKLKDVVKSSFGVIKTLFTELGSTVSTAFKSIGTVLTQGVRQLFAVLKQLSGGIVDVVNTIVTKVGSGLGKLIKTLLTSIGDGLESFGAKAVRGAATLLVLSSALFVSAKAIQQFASVKWDDVAKAGAAIGGLTVVAMLLGSASQNMILGAAALALLGAALIPAAYALQMFSEVSWDSLAKAGVALLGLTTGVAALGAIMMSGIGAAVLLSGAAALAIMGAALIPLASAVQKFNGVDFSGMGQGFKDLGSGIRELAKIEFAKGDRNPANVMAKLASASEPIQAMATVIHQLTMNILELSNALINLDTDKLSQLSEQKGMFGGSLLSDISDRIERSFSAVRDNTAVKQASVGYRFPLSGEESRATPQPPTKESTAQHVMGKVNVVDTTSSETTSSPQEIVQRAIQETSGGIGGRKIEMLLTQILQELQGSNTRPMVVEFDDGTLKTLNYRIKGMNNSR